MIVMKGVKYSAKRFAQWLDEDGAVWVDIKRDEFRGLVEVAADGVRYLTASGKGEHFNIPRRIARVFRALANEFNTSRFDVGFMVNDSFDLTRRTLKASKTVYDLTGKTEQVIMDGTKKKPILVFQGRLRLEIFLYDLPDVALPYTYNPIRNKRSKSRRKLMIEMAARFPEWLRTTDGAICFGVTDAEGYFEDSIANGHEGLMCKRLDYKWTSSRTTAWMKMKPDAERDGVITGFNPAKPGKFEGLIGSVCVQFVDGSTADCDGMKLADRVDMTNNPEKYTGKIAVVNFMQRDTKGGYRHPKFYRLHEEKTDLSECD